MDLKLRVREIRDEGYTLARIAQETGSKTSTISEISTGRTKSPRYDLGREIVLLHERVKRKAGK
jgi:transcriptional regulator with XRE-family HTH domain